MTDVLLLGIDDTDNLTSPGTGYLAQQLLKHLDQAGLAQPIGATRHQLLVDPRVPYTSHNSSACLAVHARATRRTIFDAAAAWLIDNCATGSDPGLAVTQDRLDGVAELVHHGRDAKRILLDQPSAHRAAQAGDCLLAGLGGTNDGVIGALAAVGLHLSGSDGFYIWLPGIRELPAGRYPAHSVLAALPVADARTAAGERPAADELVEVDPWIRPLFDGGRPVLLLERIEVSEGSDAPIWRTASRAVMRTY